MAKHTPGAKVQRPLDLLTGLYDLEVRARLVPHGLDAAELERGWQLLRA
jgi:hypothetical protein